MDRSTISRLANRFRGGCVSIVNEPRPGRPRKSRDERSLKLMADALEEVRRATREELSRATGVPAASVFHVLTNDLKKRKISARWVPRCLTAEHKLLRLNIATLLKTRFEFEYQVFLLSIVVIDETSIRDFEPELKSESKKWRTTGSPRKIGAQANDLCL